MAHCRERAGVPALLVDRCLRGGRRFAAARDRSARRQPPRDDADVQHLEDRGRGRRAHDVPAVRGADDDRAPQRSLRRRRRLARVPPRADAGRARGSGASRTGRVASIRSTTTTSSRRCRACSRRRRCPRRSSTGAATKRRASKRGASTWASSSVSRRASIARRTRSAASRPTTRSGARSSGPTKVGWKDGMRRMVEAQVAVSASVGRLVAPAASASTRRRRATRKSSSTR